VNFKITLPVAATISRFAMRVGDRWQEGVTIELIPLPQRADKAITLTACKFRGDGPASRRSAARPPA